MLIGHGQSDTTNFDFEKLGVFPLDVSLVEQAFEYAFFRSTLDDTSTQAYKGYSNKSQVYFEDKVYLFQTNDSTLNNFLDANFKHFACSEGNVFLGNHHSNIWSLYDDMDKRSPCVAIGGLVENVKSNKEEQKNLSGYILYTRDTTFVRQNFEVERFYELPQGEYFWMRIIDKAYSHGESIRIIQQALIAKNYDIGMMVPNNVNTVAFREALLQFQKDNNLPEGTLNIETLKALGIEP